MFFRTLIFFCLCVLPLQAHATDWTMQPDSTLGFTARYQGESFDGRFTRFSSQIRFDPAHLATSVFDVQISLASVDTQNSERDDLLKGVDFFNSKTLPQARYRAGKFRALGSNRYAADGTLSLHGITRPVTLTFSWIAGEKTLLQGQAQLKRLAFGIGNGDWADTAMIADEVLVKTRLVLIKK